MKINPFFKSKVFAINLAIATVLIVAIISSVLWALNIYTRHNEFYIVPNLYGMDASEAQMLLEEDNLHFKVTDSIYQKDIPANSIIEQFPKAGVKVKKNRNISLTICSSKPESIPFPNIKDMPFRQTLNNLETLGFKVGNLIYREHEYKNLVLELNYNNDSIAPGTMIEKGSVIDIIIGSGEDNEVLIPLIYGKTMDEAKSIINYSYLNMGEVFYDNTIKTKKDLKQATIWKQIPAYDKDKMLQAGEKINIWLTLDKTRKVETDSLTINNSNIDE